MFIKEKDYCERKMKMEIFIANKDDQKYKTKYELINLFKLEEINYIIYRLKEGEKSVTNIYIGKLEYGENNLVIKKIDDDKQNTFLSLIKSILSGQTPETIISDYVNIIEAADIILDSTQKIQVPTDSLHYLINYPEKEKEDYSFDVPLTNTEATSSSFLDINEKDLVKEEVPEKEIESDVKSSPITYNSEISEIERLALETEANKKKDALKKEKRKLSPSIKAFLILAIIGTIALFLIATFM
jgi:hypothetical protein